MKAKPNKNTNRINRIARSTLLFFSMLLPVNLIAQSSDSSFPKLETKEDKMLAGILITIAVLWILRQIWRSYNSNKCPHCKKRRALRIVDKEYIGKARTERVKNPNGGSTTVYYYKVLVTEKCKYCGYTLEYETTEKG